MPQKKKRANQEYSTNLSLWRDNIPLLYDSIYNEKLECPSYACTFGNLLSSSKYFNKYRLFQSRATNANYLKDKHIWQGLPHALLICDVYIKDRESIEFHNECNVDIIKRIIHPGPILRIKQMHQYPQIVATHTQHKYVFLWNTATQHDREMLNNSDPNTPELILKGHKKDAVYALDFSHNDFGVASGSKDNRICIWNIGDYESVLSSNTEPDKKERFVPLSKPSPKLKPRIILKGHLNEVSDVEFAPHSPYIISSVSFDKSLKIWDIRCDVNKDNEIDNKSIGSVSNLHNTSITNLSWNTFNNNYILTASSDGIIKLLDIRKIDDEKNNKCLNVFNGHKKKISSLQWNPSDINSNYFLSSSHDGTVIIWDINKDNKDSQIIFKHIGHINEYQGNEVIHSSSWIKNNDSWCIASTSSPKAFVPFFWSSSSDKNDQNDTNNTNNNDLNPNDISQGGIMQIWKPSLLLKMDRNHIIQHLKQKKGKKFIDDQHKKTNKKKKKNKKNKNNEKDKDKNKDKDNDHNKNNHNKNNHIDDDDDDDENNEDIDIQMIDINKNE